MCNFCDQIAEYRGIDIEDTSKSMGREKLIIVKDNECEKLRFYGFNKYHYEDDALYKNIEVNFCPVCGKYLNKEKISKNWKSIDRAKEYGDKTDFVETMEFPNERIVIYENT